ncbi:MAG: hypothetical protein R2726_18100 [Acidimicrobiales bacterium]
MCSLVRLELLAPSLELPSLVGHRGEERLGEGDRDASMAEAAVDDQLRRRLPRGLACGLVPDRSGSQEAAKGVEERSIPLGHRHREDESEALATISARRLHRNDAEAAFASDEAAEEVTGRGMCLGQ